MIDHLVIRKGYQVRKGNFQIFEGLYFHERLFFLNTCYIGLSQNQLLREVNIWKKKKLPVESHLFREIPNILVYEHAFFVSTFTNNHVLEECKRFCVIRTIL